MYELLSHYESVVDFLSWKFGQRPFDIKLRVELMEAEYKYLSLKEKLDAV